MDTHYHKTVSNGEQEIDVYSKGDDKIIYGASINGRDIVEIDETTDLKTSLRKVMNICSREAAEIVDVINNKKGWHEVSD